MYKIRRFDESNTEKLFEEIDQLTFSKRKDNHGEDIEWSKKVEEELISKVGSKLDISKIETGLITRGVTVIDIYITNFRNGSGDKRFQLYTIQSPDEWFYVKEKYLEWTPDNISTGRNMIRHRAHWSPKSYGYPIRFDTYYKCDTMDGLVDLINDARERIYKK